MDGRGQDCVAHHEPKRSFDWVRPVFTPVSQDCSGSSLGGLVLLWAWKQHLAHPRIRARGTTWIPHLPACDNTAHLKKPAVAILGRCLVQSGTPPALSFLVSLFGPFWFFDCFCSIVSSAVPSFEQEFRGSLVLAVNFLSFCQLASFSSDALIGRPATFATCVALAG